MQAMATEQPRDDAPRESVRALGGRKTVTIQLHGNLRTAEPRTTEGVQAGQPGWIQCELLITPYGTDQVMLTPQPPSPLQGDVHLFAVALDIDGDALEQHPHDFLAVFCGRHWGVPEPRDIVGYASDSVALPGCQL